MRRIAMYLDKPGSKWAAAAVGGLAAAAVAFNVMLVSCQEGSRAGDRARQGEVGSARGTGKGGGPVGDGVAAGERGEGVRFASEPDLRVRVASAVESANLSCAAGLMAASGDPNPLLASEAGGAKGQNVGVAVTIGLQAGSWVLIGSGGVERARIAAGAALVVWAVDEGKGVRREGGAPIGLAGGTYFGRLRLTARSDVSERAFDVVEFVPIEQYLPGVLAKELPPGWPAEAYRLQAVCARTYALQERWRNINAGGRFDVESSDKDQVYGGATLSGPWADAVSATRGRVLLWSEPGGPARLLRAYFSSTCGGRTGAAKDIWPTGPGWEFNLAAPIQSHPRECACQASPLYRWTVVRDRQELVKRLRAYGEKNGLPVKKIRDLGAIEVLAEDEDHRPSKYRVVEAGGGEWYAMSAEDLRVACNADALGCPAIEKKTRVNSGDLQAQVSGNLVTISGRGFGHGVGMCQFCARGFAERGEDWRKMAARFYPGARVGTAY